MTQYRKRGSCLFPNGNKNEEFEIFLEIGNRHQERSRRGCEGRKIGQGDSAARVDDGHLLEESGARDPKHDAVCAVEAREFRASGERLKKRRPDRSVIFFPFTKSQLVKLSHAKISEAIESPLVQRTGQNFGRRSSLSFANFKSSNETKQNRKLKGKKRYEKKSISFSLAPRFSSLDGKIDGTTDTLRAFTAKLFIYHQSRTLIR